ncbi:MAG: sodium:calcium antiporter [Nitrososphaeria archaeon]
MQAIVAVVGLILGLAVLVLSSDKAVDHSLKIASAWGVPPLMMGLLLGSVGTDLPEMANSITACALGHGDIDVGDSLGSVLTQITLVLGLVSFLGGKFRVKRREIAVIGACQILALIISVSIVEKGYFTRLNALFLVVSWPIFMLITGSYMAGKVVQDELAVERTGRKVSRDFIIALLGFIGVAVGSYVVVRSVITLSEAYGLPEYLTGFFILSIGTSLPELVVEVTAIRKKEYEFAIGDAIGSCIVDASLSIGIGQLLFPTRVSGGLAMVTGTYAIFASIVVLAALALREKLDRKSGLLFIAIYLLSYTALSAV